MLSVPAIMILSAYRSDMITYGDALIISGDMAVKLLLVTLTITPLRRLFPTSSAVRFLTRIRRALGVAVFGYAALHLAIYVERKADLSRIWAEAWPPDLLTGWIAFFIFLALAITSNNRSVRRLGPSWKTLHKLVYIGAGLTIAHWILTAFNPAEAYISGIILLVLMFLRLRRRSNQ